MGGRAGCDGQGPRRVLETLDYLERPRVLRDEDCYLLTIDVCVCLGLLLSHLPKLTKKVHPEGARMHKSRG